MTEIPNMTDRELLIEHGVTLKKLCGAITELKRDNEAQHEELFKKIDSVIVSKISNNQPHIFTNPRKDWYEFTPIIDSRYLYIEYHQCDNQPGKETVTEFALDLETHIKNNNLHRNNSSHN